MRIRFTIVFRALLLAGAMGALPAMAEDPTMTGPYASVYAEAHHLITSERVVEGAEMLVQFLRDVPTDDATVTGQALGHAQLAAFAYTRLMSQTERRAFAQDVLSVPQVIPAQFSRSQSEHPSDRLFNAAISLASRYDMERRFARAEAARLAEAEHNAIGLAAVFLLGASGGFKAEATNTTAGRLLVLSLPRLELTRAAIDWPVFEAMALARNPERSHAYGDAPAWRLAMDRRSSRRGEQPGSNRFLLEELAYWDGNHRQAYAISPGLAAAAHSLPSMQTSAVNEAVIAEWAERAADESDWRVRDTLVGLMAAGAATDAERAAARQGLEAVAALHPDTADVIRAQLALVDLALDAHDAEAARAALSRLLSNGPLPTAGNFLAYEAAFETTRKAVRYFTDYGHYALAIATHEQLAAKYPETPPSRGERERAERLRREPVTATVELLDREVYSLLTSAQSSLDNRSGNHEMFIGLAVERLEDIIERTPNSGLQATLINRVGRIQTSPLPVEFFRPKRQPFRFQDLAGQAERRDLID